MSTSPISPNSVGGVAASPVKVAFAGLWKQPAFAVVFGILVVAAVGLNGATNFLQLHFKKQPVSLQKVLSSVPKRLGPWVQTSLDMPLSHDIQEVLGTDKYFFRTFIDSRVVPASRLAEFEGKDYKEREQLQERIRAQFPKAVIQLSVTYYTGMVDTVAHIPDRCFLADGFSSTAYELPLWKINGVPVGADGWQLEADGGKRVFAGKDTGTYADIGLPVRDINFEDQDLRSVARNRNVTYFFTVNGRYEANPLGVRQTLQDLFQKNGYYAKVEMMTMLPDLEQSAAVKRDFLSFALPELTKCFPDWNAVLNGTAVTVAAPEVVTTSAGGAATQAASAGATTGAEGVKPGGGK